MSPFGSSKVTHAHLAAHELAQQAAPARAQAAAHALNVEAVIERRGDAGIRRCVGKRHDRTDTGDPSDLPERLLRVFPRKVLQHLAGEHDVHVSVAEWQRGDGGDDVRSKIRIVIHGHHVAPGAPQPLGDQSVTGPDLEHPSPSKPEHLVDLVPEAAGALLGVVLA
jgi:hypothetical protein